MTRLIVDRFAGGQLAHRGAERQPLVFVRPETAADPVMSCHLYRVAPGNRVTLHKHLTKSELWYIVSGRGMMTVGSETFPVEPGTAVLTPVDTPHALDNTGDEPVVFFNVAHPPSRRDAAGNVIGTIELEPLE